jgi:hypothetical protein
MKTLEEAWYVYLAIGCAAAWVAYAEHPDAKRLRTAISTRWACSNHSAPRMATTAFTAKDGRGRPSLRRRPARGEHQLIAVRRKPTLRHRSSATMRNSGKMVLNAFLYAP